MGRLTVATYNVYYKTSAEEMEQQIVMLLGRCDAVALQETYYHPHVLTALRQRGFGVYAGENTGLPETSRCAVAWNKGRMQVLAKGVKETLGDTYVGDAGAQAGDHVGPKYVVWVRFRLESGRLVTIGSTHIVPSVKVDDLHKQAALTQVRSTSYWSRLLRRSTPIIGGDWNLGPEDDILDPLREAGLRNDMGALGKMQTHAIGCIDHVWFRPGDGVKAVSHSTFEGKFSDHDGVIATFTL